MPVPRVPVAAVALVLLVVSVGAAAPPKKPKPLTAPQAAMLAAVTAAKATGCGTTIATHVYNPQRLTVYSPCITVTGRMADATAAWAHPRKDGVRKEPDGDPHGWIDVDPPFKALLNSGNMTHEGGNLVFEIVCYWKPTQTDAIGACPASYTNKIALPPVGRRIEITGVFVQDDNHQHWMEIHPVTKIRLLP